jgi:hypothetical protein
VSHEFRRQNSLLSSRFPNTVSACATTTAEIAVHGITLGVSVTNSKRRRHITQEAGQALEIFGHSIEYLTHQYVLEVKQISAG